MVLLTMQSFLINPTGKHSANIARRDRIRADLTARFQKLYREQRKNFSVTFFRLPKDQKVVCRITVPSEELNKVNFTYDTMVEFTYPPSAQGLPTSVNFDSLKHMSIRVFSNSPGFTFTYAYVFNQEDLIIDWMKPRLSRRSLTEAPDKRNPDYTLGFEKSLYFSMLYLQEFSRTHPKLYMNDWSKMSIMRAIPTANQKLEENKKKKDEMKKKKIPKQNLTRLLSPLSLFGGSRSSSTASPRQSAKKPIGATVSKSRKQKLGASARKPLVTRVSRTKSTRS